MPSYMTIVVIALAASNVSVALSAPVMVPVPSSREAREQSLSRRDNPPRPGHSVPIGHPYQAPVYPPPAGGPPNKGIGMYLLLSFLAGGTTSLVVNHYINRWREHGSNRESGSSREHGHATSPTTSTDPNNPNVHQLYPTYPYGPYQNQRRAVDHDKSVDFLGPSEAKDKSISDDHRGASRDDLGEDSELKLLSRVLDELD